MIWDQPKRSVMEVSMTDYLSEIFAQVAETLLKLIECINIFN